MDPSSCITEESNNKGRLGRRRDYDDTRDYKSKNLHAERKRRQKLSDRLLTLRSLVPNITNMNKATIIDDAINYIQKLKEHSEALQNLLDELDTSSPPEGEEGEVENKEEMVAAQAMKQHGIMEVVEVSRISENKQWVRIVLEKRRGRFTKLVEGMNCFGLQLTDTSVTASNGAILVLSCIEGIYGDTLTIEQTKGAILEIISTIN